MGPNRVDGARLAATSAGFVYLSVGYAAGATRGKGDKTILAGK